MPEGCEEIQGKRIIELDKLEDLSKDFSMEVDTGGPESLQISKKQLFQVFSSGINIPIAGAVRWNGSVYRTLRGSFTSNVVGIGLYRITHNLGHQNYIFLAITSARASAGGSNTGPAVKIAMCGKADDYLEVATADDSSLNPAGFDFIILDFS